MDEEGTAMNEDIVQIYQTKDGKIFANYAQAERHLKVQAAITKIGKLIESRLEDSFRLEQLNEIAEWVLQDRDAIMQVYNELYK